MGRRLPVFDVGATNAVKCQVHVCKAGVLPIFFLFLSKLSLDLSLVELFEDFEDAAELIYLK